MNTAMPSPAPRPKPLLAALLAVALFGGASTLATMTGAGQEPPSVEEMRRALAGTPMFRDAPPEAVDQALGALHAVSVEQAKLGRALRPLLIVLGLALAGAYWLAAVFAMRAWRGAPRAARPLSLACLWVLPARVAMAAVEIATVQRVKPAAVQAMSEFLERQPPELSQAQALQAEALARALSWTPVALTAAPALFVVLLFAYAWRYFQRPAVVALYDKPPPG